VGCYTSQARVKRRHRRLENELFSAEKMITAAFAQGLMDYPEEDLRQAAEDLAFVEFHDLLPGSSIPAGEEGALRTMDHGLEILSRLKARAFFALAAGERRARGGEIPILAFNPHPVPVRALLECEFEPREPNLAGGFWNARISRGGKRLRSQVEKEASTLSVEWRKKVVFEADLAPSSISRFDCRLETLGAKPRAEVRPARGLITVKNGRLEASIDTRTGLLDRTRVGGRDVLGKGALALLVVKDDADSWGMKVRSFPGREGTFRPASPREAARISGLGGGTLPPVRVVEDGEVRTVVESVLVYGKSAAVLRTKLPKRGTEIEVELLVDWAEKDRMLKLSLPSLLREPEFVGQVAFGRGRLPAGGDEAVSQKWQALVSKRDGLALRVVDDGVYGSDFKDGELRISLLRSPAYAADTAPGELRGPRDRFLPRQDQGERTFRFWIDAGSAAGLMGRVDREALARNEAPAVLPCFPPGKGRKVKPGLLVTGPAVLATAFKKAEDGKDLVVRLFEPTGKRRNVTVAVPAAGARKTFEIGPFEIKTFRLNPRTRRWTEADLLERPLRKRRGRE
jgi:alpha-mannosidase